MSNNSENQLNCKSGIGIEKMAEKRLAVCIMDTRYGCDSGVHRYSSDQALLAIAL
jgi:hypothetical protein